MRVPILTHRLGMTRPLSKLILPALLAMAAAVPARAQSLYWDGNGPVAGAGATPTGAWGTDALWSTDPNGELATAAWTAGATAIFSAGTDANTPFVVTVSGTQTAAGVAIEEGAVTLATGTVSIGAGAVTVGPGATLITDSSLRIAATAGSVMTINGGTVRTTNPSSAGSFVDVDQVIALGTGGGTFSYTVPNVLNIVQATTIVSGTGPLIKEGVGVLAVASPCTYSGATIINDGELRIRTTANRLPITTPVTVNSPGILNLNSVSQQIGALSGNGTIGLGSGTLTMGDATDTIFYGSISNYANAGAGGVTTGSGRISKQGTGSLTLMGTNAFTGSLTNNAGNLIVAPNAVLCDPVADVVVNGGALILSNATQTILSLSGTGGTVDLTTGHTLTVNPASTRTFSGSLVGPGTLVKTGTGTLGLAGNNTYEGITFVNAGELAVSSATALGSTSAGTEVASGAELLFEGAANIVTINEPLRIAGPGSSDGGAIAVQASANVTIAGAVTLTGDTTNTVSGTGTVLYSNPNAITALANQNLTLQGGGLSTGNGGTIAGVISLGTGGLTKQQGGRWTLAAGNSYSGPTTVSAGTLRVANTTGSATGSGAVSVAAGATLSGAGSIAGVVTLDGTIAPGASPGTLTTGSETWNGGGSYVWELNDAAGAIGTDPGWDLININGTLTITATPASKFNVKLVSLTPANAAGEAANFDGYNQDYTWTILKTTGGITGFDASAIAVDATGFVNPRAPGIFVVELTNGGNDLQVRFIRGLTIVAQPANQSAECTTGSATFSVTVGGLEAAAYQWRHLGVDVLGATASTLTVNPTLTAAAGAYDVVLSNSFGMITSAVATLTLVDTTLPVITVCAPAQILSAGANCQVAIPDLTELVTASDTCSTVTRSQSPAAGAMVGVGTHSVTITVRDAANNEATCTAMVTVNDTTAPSITTCAPGQSITASLASCQAAIPDLTTQVIATDNCLGTVTVTQNPIAGTLVGVGAHTVTLTATDVAGNSANCQATLTVTTPVSVTVNSPTICPGGSTMLTATTAAASPTYLWSPGGATTQTITVSPESTTAYTVTVTDGVTGCTGSGSGTVTVGTALIVTVNSATICPGDSIQLTASTAASSPTYLWSPGGETTASITVSPASTATYSVTVTDASSCTGSGSGTVTVKEPVAFANNAGVTINDNGAASPYPSVIAVSGQTATVCRVTVTLNGISHPFPDDLDIVLVGPNGQGVLLMSDVGNADALNGVTLTFEDSAAASLPDSGVIASGTYKPTNYGAKEDGRPDNFPPPAPAVRFGTNLNAFAGINPNGNWSLHVVDDEAVDAGTITGWSIAITTLTPFADVSVAQATIPNPVAAGSNLTFTVTVTNHGPATADGITLADTLPAGVTFVSATASQGSCTPGTGTVDCNIGTLLAGQAATVNIVVVPTANSVIANSATVASTTLDFVTANNTSSANVTVLDAPAITVQPLAQTVCRDLGFSLAVTASGSAPLTYQWYQDAVAIPGATAAIYTVANAQVSHTGSYTVIVANDVGAASSSAAAVLVNPLPTVTVNSETICLGGSAILTATTSAANAAYLWSPGGQTSASITVSPASTTIYTVLVTDGGTTCTNSASGTVTVNPLTVATAIQSYTNICPGGSVTFSTVASGTPPFSYEWRKGSEAIAGQVTDTLSLPSVVLADGGTYSVVVTGACGAVTNSGTLSVVAPPTITSQPASQATPMGNGAVFTVAASSVVASNIQWQLNGVDITGATSTSLAVSNVTLADKGAQYRAVIANCGGSTTSLAATLTVTPVSGISFDFNTPGQFTNAPYYLSYNNWVNNGYLASGSTPTVYEFPIGGVGPNPGSGSLDLASNSGSENTSLLVPVSFDFSLPGKTLFASTMFKLKSPLANNRSTQIGFVSATNAGINDVAGQGFMTMILQSIAQPAPTFDIRMQRRLSGGGLHESTALGGSASLTVSNWYQFRVKFENTKGAGTASSNFTVSAWLQDMGPLGTTPGATNLVVENVAAASGTNFFADMTSFKNVYLAIRQFENTGIDFRDNTYAWTKAGDIAFVQAPQNLMAMQGSRAVFRAYVDGEGPYTYVWQRGDGSGGFTNIPLGGSWNLITEPTRTSDNGAQIRVVVTGPANSITSDPVTLTVTPQTLAVVSAGSVDGSTVGVLFNQPVDPATAENVSNYSINGAAPAQARVYRTSLSPSGPDGIHVVLTPASPIEGAFTVTASGVQDLSGGSVGAANSASGTVAGLTGFDVNPGITGPPGENYSFGPGRFIVTGGGADIFSGGDGFRFVYTTRTGDFDMVTRVSYVDTVRFTAKSGIDARVSLDPYSPGAFAGFDPGPMGEGSSAVRQYMEGTAKQTWGAGGTSWGANPRMFLPDVWVRLRRAGNTFIRYSSTNGVNWTYDGQITPPAFAPTLYLGMAVCSARNLFGSSAQFENFGDFAGYPGAIITINTQPTNVTFAANSSATIGGLTATVSGGGVPTANERMFTWQRADGLGGWTNLPTAVATNSLLPLGNVYGSDNGAQFRAIVTAPGALSVTSAVATLTVTDTAAPTLTSVNPNILPSYPVSEVVLNFNEPMSDATALNIANYTVTNAAGVRLTVLSATFLSGDPRTVILKVDGQLGNGSASVGISNLRDQNNNALPTTVRSYRSFLPSTAPVVVEVFQDIGATATPITNLTQSTLFLANTPTYIAYSNLFGFNVVNGFTTSQDNYGVKAYTYFVAPSNGLYKFWIRSDDAMQLWMNTTSTNPVGRVLICENTAANGNYSVGTTPGTSITNVSLTAGQTVYMEALLKEGTGGDGFSVTWTDPTVNTAPATSAFIPTANLAYPTGAAPSTPVVMELYTGYQNFLPGFNQMHGLITATNLPTSSYALEVVNYKYIAGLPDVIGYQKYFGVQPATLANTRLDNYLGKIHSYFIPPSNGVYRFWLAVDDVAQLFMNTNAVNSTDPSGAVFLGQSANAFVSTASQLVAQNVALNGGQRYYMSALWREGGGGDGVRVAVRAQSDNAAPPVSEVIPASMLEYPGIYGRAGAVNIMAIAPAGLTVADGQSLTLSAAGISGAAPYGGITWFKNGVKIAENTFTNITPPLTMADNGSVYTVVVTNAFSRGERSATLTVLPDNTAPTIVRTLGQRDNNAFSIVFNEPVNPLTATYLGNYQISGGVRLLRAILDPTRTMVTIQTTPQTPGTVYTVTLNGVRDASSTGNLIAANTTTSFSTWAVGGSGFMVELFTNAPGSLIADLTGLPKFVANVPDFVYYTNVFGAGVFAANSGLENYGARVSGYFIPTNTGFYRFHIRSDDSSQLWMNINSNDSENPAGRVMLAHNINANLNINDPKSMSVPIPLNQGQRYYIEALLKEGGGGDYVQVTFRPTDANGTSLTPVPVDNTIAENSTLASFGGAGISGNPDLIQIIQAPPGDVFAQESELVALRLTANIPLGIVPAVTYQWQKSDGVTFTNIPGATASALTFYAALADNDVQYRLLFSAPGRTASYVTTLHVTADTQAPYIIAASSLDGKEIHLCFNEPVTAGTAGDSFSYTVNNGNSIVLDAYLRPDGISAVVKIETPITGAFTVEAAGIQDQAANANLGTSSTNGVVQGFQPLDVGAPAGVGSTFSCTPGEMNVIAGGSDIWAASDQGHLTLTPRNGNFDIYARVQSLSRAVGDNDSIAKAGLMVRQTLDANSRTMHLLVNPPTAIGGRDQGEAGVRLTVGGTTADWFSALNRYVPVGIPNGWIRLRRVGDVFTAFRSTDGVNWTTVSTLSQSYVDPVYIGLATTGHVPAPSAATTYAEYRDIHIPALPTILVQPSPATQTLALNSSTSYSVVVSNPPNGGPLTYQWRRDGVAIGGANSATLALNNLQANQSGDYSVLIGNDGGTLLSASATLFVSNALPTVVSDSLIATQGVARTVAAADLIANDSDPEGAALSLLAVSGLAPASFVSDFNSGLPAGSAVFGNALADTVGGVGDSGALKLTAAAASQSGSYILEELTPGRRVSAFTASFKLRIAEGSAEPADGFSFNFASDLPIAATTPAAAENGGGTGLSFCVDNYRFAPYPGGGNANTSGLKLRFGGVDIAGIQTATWNRNAFIPVTVSMSYNGVVRVIVDGTNVFGDITVPYTPRTGRFGFYARTGGSLEAHTIDDLNIHTVLTVETARETAFGGNLYGTAYVEGGALHLTDAVNNQLGSFVLNELSLGQPVTGFTANFKLQIGSGSADGADGFSLNFANDLPNAATGATTAEDGLGSGLSICVDNYVGGTMPAGPAVRVKYAGTFVHTVQIPKWNSPNFIPVSVKLDPDGTVDVTIDGTNVIDSLATAYTPTVGRFGLFARTGGLNQRHWVDDLAITATTAGSPGTFTADFNSSRYATVVLTNGVVVYAPPAAVCGPDTFYYLVSDGQNGGVNVGTVNVQVERINPTAPVITSCVGPITLQATANCQAVLPNLTGGLRVEDCGVLSIGQSPAPGTPINLGSTVVTFNVTNDLGLTATCQTTVTVVDTQPPQLVSCATAPLLTAGANCSAALPDLRSEMLVNDACAVTISQVPTPGSILPLGTTPVTLTATDSSGNSTNCGVIVTVLDTTAPAITCPANITVPCTGANGAIVTFAVTALDNCDANPVVTSVPASGATFPIGTTIVTNTAVDVAGNTNICTFTVTVQDSPVPTMTIVRQGANVVITWPQTCTPYVLEESPVLGAGASWTTSSATIDTVGADYRAIVPAAGNKFYRLKKQP